METGLSSPAYVYQYTDIWGRKTKESIKALKNNAETTYSSAFTTDLLGNILTATDFKNNKTIYTYDHLNRLTITEKTINGTQRKSTITYDSYGNKDSVKDFNQELAYTYKYNKIRQVIEIKSPFDATYNHSTNKKYYDKNGNLTRDEQQNNKLGATESYAVTRYIYDNMNRLSATIGNDGTSDNVVKYQYDNAGNIEKLITGLNSVNTAIDPSKHSVTTYQYTKTNRLKSVTDPLGYTAVNVYDKLGNVVSGTDKNGQSLSFEYDGLGRLTKKTAGAEEIGYTYNIFGNISTMTDNSGLTKYEYDGHVNLI